MAKKTKQAKSAIPYVQRLAEDDYIQGQLRNAAGRLREVYARTRRERGRAVEDKKLYANLREAATSVRKAGSRLQRKPKPKRRGRKIAAAAVAGGGAALLWRRKGNVQADGGPAARPNCRWSPSGTARLARGLRRSGCLTGLVGGGGTRARVTRARAVSDRRCPRT